MKLCSNIIIVANLPYLTQKEYSVEPSIQFEPRQSLVADYHGLGIYKKLLPQVKDITKSGQFKQGQQITLLFEINPQQRHLLVNMLGKILPPATIKFYKDLYDLNRLAVISVKPPNK